jgi:hypothetical protein
VLIEHEAETAPVDDCRAFAAECLSRDRRRIASDIERRRMELDELRVGDERARPSRHRQAFAARFPESQTAAVFVSALYASAGVTPTQAETDEAVAAFGAGGASGRAAALRKVADSASLGRAEFNPAFVLMEYFGYLRRNPTQGPDTDFSGYDFWLSKLNEFGGNYIAAEMVKAFINSAEYRQRFGQ